MISLGNLVDLETYLFFIETYNNVKLITIDQLLIKISISVSISILKNDLICFLKSSLESSLKISNF